MFSPRYLKEHSPPAAAGKVESLFEAVAKEEVVKENQEDKEVEDERGEMEEDSVGLDPNFLKRGVTQEKLWQKRHYLTNLTHIFFVPENKNDANKIIMTKKTKVQDSGKQRVQNKVVNGYAAGVIF